MTTEDEPKNSPDDDESARRAAAEELQEQIDALARGGTEAQPDRPRSLREFIERGGRPPLGESTPPEDDSPEEGIQRASESDDSGAAGKGS